jgi:hypothetical protein
LKTQDLAAFNARAFNFRYPKIFLIADSVNEDREFGGRRRARPTTTDNR